ncbi:MAG: hypothetical protein ACRD0I_08650 [Acidimicrobiales bacterium]
MFKRFFWLVMGMGLGIGGSLWTVRFVHNAIEKYSPERISAEVVGALQTLGSDLRAAVGEGRLAMHEREAELRSRLETAPLGSIVHR